MMHREYIPFFIALAVSTSATAIMVYLGRRNGWVVLPRAERWSQRTVAKFGGVGILLGLFVAMPTGISNLQQWTMCVLTLLIGLMGFLDDLRDLRASHKFFVQVTVAVIAVSVGIVYPTGLGNLADNVLTVLWLVGITNAFNLLDNMDGLSAGIGLIASINLALLMHGANTTLEIMMLCMAGTLLGFLFFNFNPAKIFMGDTGSLAIGFFFACSTVLGAGRITSLFSVVFVPAL